MVWRVIALAAAAVVIAGTGVALTRSGWPFGVTVVTAHKLAALAAVVFLGALTFGLARSPGLTSAQWSAVAIAAVLAAAAVATGAIVSASESAPQWLTWAHRIGSWLSVAAAAWWAYVLYA